MPSPAPSFLHRVPILDGLDDAELGSFGRDLARRELQAGETFFYQGDPGNAVCIVESGAVRIYVHAVVRGEI